MRWCLPLLVVAACGTTPHKPAETPTGPSADLAISEIRIMERQRAILLHDDGTVELVNGAAKSVLGTLRRDGVFTDYNGVVSTLQPDGSFTPAGGTSQFTLRDETLTLPDRVVSFDDHDRLQGMPGENVTLQGVTGVETQRSALLLIGVIMTMK